MNQIKVVFLVLIALNLAQSLKVSHVNKLVQISSKSKGVKLYKIKTYLIHI